MAVKKPKAKKDQVLSDAKIASKYPGAGLANKVSVEKDDQLWLPSRCLPLTYAMGGGIPYGRILEIFGEESSGKTVVAQDFGAVCQSMGGEIIWNDGEQAFTPFWAEQNGLDPKRIHLYNSTSVEWVSDWLADMAISIRSRLVNNEPIVFIQDSIAALDCEANINGSQIEAKAEMGNRAKAIYKMVRIRNEMLAELGVISIFINQIRKKVGATKWEDPDCLNYNTLIPLIDGRVLPIGVIVRDQIKGEVWSLNEHTDKIEAKPISGWIKKEKLTRAEKWLSIITNGPGSKGGRFGIVCTEKHGLRGFNGIWKNARDFKVGDLLTSYVDTQINGTLEDFLIGSAIGDSSISIRDINTARYQLQDNENLEYLKWKLAMLGAFFEFEKYHDSHGSPKYQTPYSVDWALFGDRFKHRDPSPLFNAAPTPLTLAIWYMDDGHLMEDRQGSIAISPTRCNLKSLSKWLSDFGYFCKPYNKGIKFTKVGLYNLHLIIRGYIPGCMQYKLTPEHRNYHTPFSLSCEKKKVPLYVRILSIEEAGERNYRKPYKYDLTIADNHNFFAGAHGPGMLVHNSTPGGAAMKFFASQRLGIYAGRSIKEKVDGFEERVGAESSVRLKKNKVAPPRPTFKAKIYFHSEYSKPIGLDRYFGLGELMVRLGVVEKSPNSPLIRFKGELVGRSMDGFEKRLEKDKDLRTKLILRSKINTPSRLRTKLEETERNRYPVKVRKVVSQLAAPDEEGDTDDA